MDVPMCSQALYGHFSVLSLWTWSRSHALRIPSVHCQDLAPHTMYRKPLLMDDERKVTAMCLPLTPGSDPSRAGLPSSQSRGAQAEKWAEFQSLVPGHCLTAKCTLTKLSICSRDQMMCGFSCIRAEEERDLYLNRDVKASSETGGVTKAARLERHFNL